MVEMVEEKQLKEVMLMARVTNAEKMKLLELAHSKGCEGWTAFVRTLAYAKEVKIIEL